jgi:hypothetical protein
MSAPRFDSRPSRRNRVAADLQARDAFGAVLRAAQRSKPLAAVTRSADDLSISRVVI